MTINEIYAAYTTGSNGFIKAVQTHCGFDCSDDEIRRIAEHAENADQFQKIWENEDWWTDANNG